MVEEVRVEEIGELIKKVKEDSKTINMSFDKLMIGGHSLGGITALECARVYPEIKHVLAIDPSMLSMRKKVMDRNFKINQPALIVFTE